MNTIIDKKKNIDRNYTSKNILIKLLIGNLSRKINNLFIEIEAVKLKGLDVGCGEAHMLSYLYENNVISNTVASDLNLKKINHAKIRLSNFKFVQNDVLFLPFKNDIFDYISAFEILEHIKFPEKAMMELSRIAKDGAWFLISVPHEPFFQWGNILRGKYLSRGGRTPAHCNFWKITHMERFLLRYIDIEKKYILSTFPWMVFLGKFKRF